MAGNDKKTGSNPVDMIVYGMMIAAVVYVIVQCILGNNDALHFKIVLGIWIVAAVAVADYIGPVLSGRISEVSDKALRLYMISSILDAAAYMGFYVCIINISKTGEATHTQREAELQDLTIHGQLLALAAQERRLALSH